MAVRHSIRDQILTLKLAGTYEPGDVVREFLAALSDPKGPALIGLIVDVSKSESLATRPATEIRKVAEFLGPYADRIGRRCAVVALKDVQFGLSQMGSLHSEHVGVATRVFRTKAEALSWLHSGAASI